MLTKALWLKDCGKTRGGSHPHLSGCHSSLNRFHFGGDSLVAVHLVGWKKARRKREPSGLPEPRDAGWKANVETGGPSEKLRGTPRGWQEWLRGKIENSVKASVGIRTTICLGREKSRLDREFNAQSKVFWIWTWDAHWKIPGLRIREKSLGRFQVTRRHSNSRSVILTSVHNSINELWLLLFWTTWFYLWLQIIF